MKKVYSFLLDFLKGIGIGIANVIPGFSGGTMAVMLNIYDKFVYAFAQIIKDFKNVIKTCYALFLGILCGIVLGVFAIVKFLELFPFITIMFFVGLTIGAIPMIYKKAKVGKIHIYDVISFIISLAILIILPLIQTTQGVFEVNVWLLLLVFILGIICASAMVIPGISGSLCLMAFGYYGFVMGALNNFFGGIFNFSANGYFANILVIASFGIGCVVGLIFISKLIRILLFKYPKTVYFSILGLLLASPFSIIYTSIGEYSLSASTFTIPTIIFSIISFCLGTLLCFILPKLTEKVMKKQNEKSEKNRN